MTPSHRETTLCDERLAEAAEALFSSVGELRALLGRGGSVEETAAEARRLIDDLARGSAGDPRSLRCREALSVILGAPEALEALSGLAAGRGGCSPSFVIELERLFAGLRPTERPVPLDDDRQAERAARYLERYPDGLEREVYRRRHKNRVRILNALGGTPSQWDDWLWQIRNSPRSLKELAELVPLSDGERRLLSGSGKAGWTITPYYLSLFDDDDDGVDRALRNRALSPRPGPTRGDAPASREGIERLSAYSVRLVLHAVPDRLCSYRAHTEPREFSEADFNKSLEWIGDHPEIVEVVIGGDLLHLDDSRIESVLAALSRHKHLRRLRIDGLCPVMLPQRFSVLLTRILGRYLKPGMLEIALLTAFIHPYEITQDVATIVERLSQSGVRVYNETPYSRDNSRRYEIVQLRRALGAAGIVNSIDVAHLAPEDGGLLRVPLARVLQEQSEEAVLLPELDRTALVQLRFEDGRSLPLHTGRRLAGLDPEDGSRLYDFDDDGRSRRRRDVPLAEYLDYLAATGENPDDYDGIWYYI